MQRRLIPHRQGLLREGWGPALAHLSVAAESCCWCTAPAALRTDEGLGWGWLGDCSLLPPASFLCGFISLCLSVSNFRLTFLSGEHCGLTWEKVYIFEKVLKHDCLWQSLIVQRWHCAVDRTLKSSYWLTNQLSQSEVFACPSSCHFCWSL